MEKTIEVICEWIRKQLTDGECNTDRQISEMVKALAELVSASAKIVGTTIVEEHYITDADKENYSRLLNEKPVEGR